MPEVSRFLRVGPNRGGEVKFELQRDHWPEVIRFSGELTMNELVRLDLSPLDRALVNDVNGSGGQAADYLLVLEMLFRRLSEQAAPTGETP